MAEAVVKEAVDEATTKPVETVSKQESSSSAEEQRAILVAQLRKELENYLSPKSLQDDSYLRNQMSRDGYVGLDVICGLKLIKNLTTDESAVKEAIRESKQLEFNDSETRVHSVTLSQRKTLILREMPSDVTKEEILKLFPVKECGPVKDAHLDVGNNWFVKFSSEEDCLRTCKYVQKQDRMFRNEPLHVRVKSTWVDPSTKEKPRAKTSAIVVDNRYAHTFPWVAFFGYAPEEPHWLPFESGSPQRQPRQPMMGSPPFIPALDASPMRSAERPHRQSKPKTSHPKANASPQLPVQPPPQTDAVDAAVVDAVDSKDESGSVVSASDYPNAFQKVSRDKFFAIFEAMEENNDFEIPQTMAGRDRRVVSEKVILPVSFVESDDEEDEAHEEPRKKRRGVGARGGRRGRGRGGFRGRGGRGRGRRGRGGRGGYNRGPPHQMPPHQDEYGYGPPLPPPPPHYRHHPSHHHDEDYHHPQRRPRYREHHHDDYVEDDHGPHPAEYHTHEVTYYDEYNNEYRYDEYGHPYEAHPPPPHHHAHHAHQHGRRHQYARDDYEAQYYDDEYWEHEHEHEEEEEPSHEAPPQYEVTRKKRKMKHKRGKKGKTDATTAAAAAAPTKESKKGGKKSQPQSQKAKKQTQPKHKPQQQQQSSQQSHKRYYRQKGAEEEYEAEQPKQQPKKGKKKGGGFFDDSYARDHNLSHPDLNEKQQHSKASTKKQQSRAYYAPKGSTTPQQKPQHTSQPKKNGSRKQSAKVYRQKDSKYSDGGKKVYRPKSTVAE